MSDMLLKVTNLKTQFNTDNGIIRAVNGVDFSIRQNETVGIVGESGCGKSVTSLSIMRLLGARGQITAGKILFNGQNLLEKTPKEMRKIRGNQISMIFQEPMTALNPVYPIGDQIVESLKMHLKLSKRRALHRAVEMLERVGIPSPELRVHEYPHQLSGGMRQRAMIAMALACNPSLLIADEPTTALDVTIQAQILDLMKDLKAEFGSSVMMITHDLGVVAETADKVVVLYAGRVVEDAAVNEIFTNPLHPYTKSLLLSIPRITDTKGKRLYTIKGAIPDPRHFPAGCEFHPRCPYTVPLCAEKSPPFLTLNAERRVRCWMYLEPHTEQFGPQYLDRPPLDQGTLEVGRSKHQEGDATEPKTLLTIRGLKKHFSIKDAGILRRTIGYVRAVDEIDFFIREGETLGLVGESGCGKTTTGRLILRLLEATAGSVQFEGVDIVGLQKESMRKLRRKMQIIFQDPFASLNPYMTVEEIIGESFYVHGIGTRRERRRYVTDLMDLVGLEPDWMRRYPHEFSGGQRQRICIAQAIALKPKFIVCDEPVSALDVSIQAQIINLLEDLQHQFNLTYLFISHDLSVVKHIADTVAVMYLGKIVEKADAETLFANPRHPYTRALLSAVPLPDTTTKRTPIILKGDVPSPSNPPSGCAFHTRCNEKMDRCLQERPVSVKRGERHWVACHLET